MSFVDTVTLEGTHVTLEPLAVTHLHDLQSAVRDGELWSLWYTFIPRPEDMSAEIQRRLDLQAKGAMLPFAVRRNDTRTVCGMTTYMNVDAVHRRVEIGSTWYAKSTQRSALNTEAKLLLLTHAFERLECIAVEFRTHWMNRQSRDAILRLGAKQDGVLRNHMRMPDGSLRDTVVFSIIESEWPAVKRHLQHKLNHPG
jgi:RimJ/RimL family protein N-acetyltransferase